MFTKSIGYHIGIAVFFSMFYLQFYYFGWIAPQKVVEKVIMTPEQGEMVKVFKNKKESASNQ